MTASNLELWARTERTFLKEELDWYEAGARLLSPNGANITGKKIESLKLRLEHANNVLGEINAQRS